MGGGGGGGGEHQTSPMTPSGHLPMTPEPVSLISPQQMKKAALRQDSQLSSASGQSMMDQEWNAQSYSRQNSLMQQQQQHGGGSREVGHRVAATINSSTTSPLGEGGNGNRTGEPLQVENILGIRNDQPVDPNHLIGPGPHVGGIQQSSSTSSSPLANSMRGGDGEGVLGSPHMGSPLGNALNPSAVTDVQDQRSPAPGRPERLGFPVRSPSFRSESQSLLTEDRKNVS